MQKGKDTPPDTSIPAHGNFLVSTLDRARFSELFPLHKLQRNNLNGLIVILTTAGEAHFQINGKDYTARRGNSVSLLPFHLIETRRLSDDFACRYLSFRFDFMADFPFVLKSATSERIGNQPYLTLSPDELSHLQEFHAFISKQHDRAEHPSREEIVKALLFSFIAELSYIYSRQTLLPSASRAEQIVDNFFRILHQHHKKQRDLSFYADKLCMTPKYLSQILKQTTGHTLYHWTTHFSLQEAKILLKSTEMSVIQISEELNYPNSSFFARFFKKNTGMTPLQFRNSKRDNETANQQPPHPPSYK